MRWTIRLLLGFEFLTLSAFGTPSKFKNVKPDDTRGILFRTDNTLEMVSSKGFVRISLNSGKVNYGKLTPDNASKAFWEAVAATGKASCKLK